MNIQERTALWLERELIAGRRTFLVIGAPGETAQAAALPLRVFSLAFGSWQDELKFWRDGPQAERLAGVLREQDPHIRCAIVTVSSMEGGGA